MKFRYRKSVGLLIIIIGLFIFMNPYIMITKNNFNADKNIEEYIKSYVVSPNEKKIDVENDIVEYNKKVKDTNISTIVDPFSVIGFDKEIPVRFYKDGIFGYIVIPRLGEKLPIYMGASQENLSKGVAQITGTSLPVGGVSTRSVIAGHRGYYKQSMFRHLDKIKDGDKIYLYVQDKRLVYEAYEREVIYPSENDKLKPIIGEDVVTLLTCTPYLSDTQRLLVDFKRVKEQNNFDLPTVKEIKNDISSQEVDENVRLSKIIISSVAYISVIIEIFLMFLLVKTIRREFKNNQG